MGRLRGFVHALIDTLLPPRARAVRLRSTHALSIAPRSDTVLDTRIVTLSPYHAPGVEDAIRALKYDGNARAATLLADALADFLREEIAHVRSMSPRPILLVPMPLHRSRKRERGFNQIERVLARLPGEFHDGTLSRVETRGLFRTRATRQQTTLSRTERLQNVRGAFSADRTRITGAHLFLIDDVCTTGATLSACVHAAEEAGARVSAIALARA